MKQDPYPTKQKQCINIRYALPMHSLYVNSKDIDDHHDSYCEVHKWIQLSGVFAITLDDTVQSRDRMTARLTSNVPFDDINTR